MHTLAALGASYGLAGKRAQAEQVIARLHGLKSQQPVQSFFFAVVYAGLSQPEDVFAWLEKAYEERNDVLLTIQILPVFDPLRTDARYSSLLQRIGFPLK